LSRFHLEIHVTPRPGILDPEGKAIDHALQSLGYGGVRDVRVGKALYLELDAASQEEARDTADEMCRKLLANPVTEDYEIHFLDEAPAGVGAGTPGGGGT
jgi:phosphoribosylformylglycinamidine synthase